MVENELEQLMRESFQDSSMIEGFYAKILSSELFVLAAKADVVDGRHILEEDSEVSLISYQMEDGTPFIPVFTSLQELQRSIEEDLRYMAMDGWNLFSLIRGSDIVLNPASEYSWHLKADDLDEILQHFGANAITVEQDTPVLMGQPAIDPVDFKKALSEVFERDGRVRSAYFCLMVNQNSGEYSFVIGVVFLPGQEYRDIFNIAGPAAGKFLPEGYKLDFMVINGNDHEGVSGALLQDGDCFFRREP